MANVLECIIVGCHSASENEQENVSNDIIFFQFPTSSSQMYDTWTRICHRSVDAIQKHPDPYICSKHFHPKDISMQRLLKYSAPVLYLNPASPSEDVRIDFITKQEKKRRLGNLINNTVREWSLRAENYADLADKCKSSSKLKAIATKVRNLLDPTLTLTFDDYWFGRFRATHLYQCLSTNNRDSTLDLASIVKSLDPEITILSEDEIGTLKKWEEPPVDDLQFVVDRPKFSGKKYGLNVTKAKDNKTETISDPTLRDGRKTEQTITTIEFRDDEFTDEVAKYEGSSDSLSSIIENYEPEIDRMQGLDIRSYKQALEHFKKLRKFILELEDYLSIVSMSKLENLLQKRADSEQRKHSNL